MSVQYADYEADVEEFERAHLVLVAIIDAHMPTLNDRDQVTSV